MEAKLKAKELVEKFRVEINLFTGNEERHSKDFAKRCALIAVDEIIKLVSGICEAFDAEPDSFWSDVKEEIATL